MTFHLTQNKTQSLQGPPRPHTIEPPFFLTSLSATVTLAHSTPATLASSGLNYIPGMLPSQDTGMGFFLFLK